MYLTKIELDLRQRAARAALADCQQMHRFLNGLFDCPREEAELLYRIQNQSNHCSVYLYSACPIVQEKLLPFMHFAGQRDLSDWLQGLTEGRGLSFDFLTMPSKKVGQESGKNSRRRVLRTAEERLAWLDRKANQNGFEILNIHELESSSQFGRHEDARGGKMVLDAYHYRGILQIRNAEQFQKAMASGIGPGKAYGLGMILLR